MNSSRNTLAIFWIVALGIVLGACQGAPGEAQLSEDPAVVVGDTQADDNDSDVTDTEQAEPGDTESDDAEAGDTEPGDESESGANSDGGSVAVASAGARLWEQTCARCHNYRRPRSRTDGEWEVILHHMRVRANIPGDEARKILVFLKSAN